MAPLVPLTFAMRTLFRPCVPELEPFEPWLKPDVPRVTGPLRLTPAAAKERLLALDEPNAFEPWADALAWAHAVAEVLVAWAKAAAATLAAERMSDAVKAVPEAKVLDIAVALTRLEIAIE